FLIPPVLPVVLIFYHSFDVHNRDDWLIGVPNSRPNQRTETHDRVPSIRRESRAGKCQILVWLAYALPNNISALDRSLANSQRTNWEVLSMFPSDDVKAIRSEYWCDPRLITF